ncbi:MAG: pentapeptide repeat-containing protein [Candidatus Thiodiazotropha sp. (ex Dulcina madagascariensis)]|nr:pentapeptide repeat-containing protein [Candidatus Thiodiazotropha sp. (ex Dulcina madagascariensis)]MCU7927361.1 pentapeptide repeat-containing protein [Candidatus Thiodiazotropha sp. (ex Dulcina madagascariensis)]
MRDYRWELIVTLAGLLAMVVSPLAAWDKSDLERLHTSSECNGCNLEGADLIGVLLEGARFSHGVRCGAFPDKGGFGCAAR